MCNSLVGWPLGLAELRTLLAHFPGTRPSAVLLDVNGTLFPITAASPVFKELGFTKDTDAVVQARTSTVQEGPV